MLITDECDRIFGAFCCEAWKISNKFYGTGESFIFSFEGDDINVYNFTGENDMAMFSDDNSLIIGGGVE
jgi:hypothetical protein